MDLRVGVVTGNHQPISGGAWTYGAWTYIETLAAAVKTAECSHTFVLLDDLLLDEGQVPDKGQGGFKARLLRRIVRAQCDEGTGAPSTRSFDVVAASEQIDLVWLMQPWSEPLPIPYIATVWDLEHRKQPYFPEVSAMGCTFSAREDVFNALLPRASMIITGTQAGKDEIVHYYRVNPANVIVIPLPVPAAPPMAPQRAGVEIKQRYGLNGDFLLYPAQSWPHKNHVNLVRGLQILRDQSDLDLSLVLTGSDKGNLGHVMEEIEAARLSDRVFVPGFVPRDHLTALYRAATALVFPSFFGPDNFPPLEAFALGCPVIAANVAGAAEQIGEGALLFDPSDPSDIAAKIETLCRMPGLRDKLIGKGKEIAKHRTPQAFIATLSAFLDRFEALRRVLGRSVSPPLLIAGYLKSPVSFPGLKGSRYRGS